MHHCVSMVTGGGHVTKSKSVRPGEKSMKVYEIMNETAFDLKHAYSFGRNLDSRNFLEIKPYQADLDKSRAEDTKTITRSINEVRRDLEGLKGEVNHETEIQNADYLRKIMFDMEEKICRLKEAIKEEFLKLLRNEASLSKDVQFMERRIEEWGKPVDVQIFKPVKQTTNSKIKPNADNPVVQFQRFLSQSGGHYGGWEEHDHLLFLKERTKYKKKQKLFSALHCLLPDLSYAKIEEHEQWYQKYESLKQSQKEAIQKWKLEKETQQTKKENEEEERKQEKKEKKSQINIAERIKEWKNQQQMKKLEHEERQKKERVKLKEEERRKLELQEMKKQAVAQYKAEKLSKFQEMFSRNDKRPSTREEKARNKVLLKEFRLQDLKFVEKKKVLRLQIESKSVEKLKLGKPALELILRRDPRRVLQPTLIWSQHCLEAQNKQKTDPVFDLNSIPRLAIPEWRRELK